MENHKLQVFYDGQCVVCSMEIDFYRRKPRQELIEWVDISNPNFKAEAHGLDPDRVHARFHAIEAGKIYEGVEAFQKIWNVLGIWKALNWSAENKALRPIFNLGYDLFVKARPYLPRKNNVVCDDNSCTPVESKTKGKSL